MIVLHLVKVTNFQLNKSDNEGLYYYESLNTTLVYL